MQMKNDKIIEVFSGTLWEAEMVKSLLDSADISCFIKNSVGNNYAYEPGFAEGVKVMILSSSMEEAKMIVEGYLQK